MHPAIENLKNCQRQLDMDGCHVGVSRQAVEETIGVIDELVAALKLAREFNCKHAPALYHLPLFKSMDAAVFAAIATATAEGGVS